MADEEEDPAFEEENEEIGGGAEGGQGKRKRLFSKELRCMMYGFGDDQNPYTESVDILEDLVIEFITEMTHKAMSIGRQGRVQSPRRLFLRVQLVLGALAGSRSTKLVPTVPRAGARPADSPFDAGTCLAAPLGGVLRRLGEARRLAAARGWCSAAAPLDNRSV
ncbi:transcription initiation factor TFIID subunit 13 [Delphinapterus leucas]|uniref:Transcription initiation factor TFIID subunit 13 n=1 Tax=Delphinapterus leucas TaxID=9749 RepID=A0A7F8K5G5_DELLE|nr:transcription initiation factor TFIID subunit 13 [Delphinapterus leucas]